MSVWTPGLLLAFDEMLNRFKTTKEKTPCLVRMKRKPAKEGILSYLMASYSLLSKQPYVHSVLPFVTLPQPSPSDFLLRTYDILKFHLRRGASTSVTLDAAFSSSDLLETLTHLQLQFITSVNTAWHNDITTALSHKLKRKEYRVWYNPSNQLLALSFHDTPTKDNPDKEKFVFQFSTAFRPKITVSKPLYSVNDRVQVKFNTTQGQHQWYSGTITNIRYNNNNNNNNNNNVDLEAFIQFDDGRDDDWYLCNNEMRNLASNTYNQITNSRFPHSYAKSLLQLSLPELRQVAAGHKLQTDGSNYVLIERITGHNLALEINDLDESEDISSRCVNIDDRVYFNAGLEQLSVPVLKDLCEKSHQKKTGTKSQIIERLLALGERQKINQESVSNSMLLQASSQYKTDLPPMFQCYLETCSPIDKCAQFISKYSPCFQIRDYSAKFLMNGFTIALCNIVTTVLELRLNQNIALSQSILKKGKKKAILLEVMQMLLNHANK